MRSASLFATLSCVAAGALGLRVRQEDAAGPPLTNETTTFAPKHYIVEFAPDSDAAAAAKEVANTNGGKILKVFSSDVFKGCAIEAHEDNADTLQALRSVSQAWPSRKFFLGPNEPEALMAGDAIIQNYSVHHMTGVDKLHEAGIRGKGAKVAIIDTGIFYDHPALGGGFGDGFKVSRGYDLVGDNGWPTDSDVKQPDEDPLDQNGHGTHVAGIVAGLSDSLVGVAPEAELFAYKVFGYAGGTDEETLIEAMLRAYEDGADIITMSIGGMSGWSDGPWALVASRLVEQGVLVTISAGNDGDVGALAASSGSSGANVLAVASINPDVITVPGFNLSFAESDGSVRHEWKPYRAVTRYFIAVEDWPVVPLHFEALEDEACEPLPEDTPDFTGKVVLVRRGGCDFVVKQQNLRPFNGNYILFYSNDLPFTAPTSFDPRAVLGMVMAETGEAIIEAVKAGGNVTANFNYPDNMDRVAVKNTDAPGVASFYTTIGPTNDLFSKSDIAAPGAQILSTYRDNGYASLSGTSMACPYVAGIAALYVGKFGGRSTHGPGWAKTLAMRIMASGEPIAWDDSLLEGNTYGDFYAPVAQVGTGLVNASKVLGYKTELSLARFALNDTHHFSRYHKVDITNTGKEPVTYKFSQQAFGGMKVMNNDPEAWATPRPAWIDEMMVSPIELAPSISFPGGTFTVKPGETKTAQFNFKAPAAGASNPKDLPVYSGKVLIHGSNGDELSVPYLGLAADLRRDNELMYQYPIGLPIFTATSNEIPIEEKSNFTFDLSLEAQDFPRAYARLQLATRELRWDIFESSWRERDWSYPPVIGERGYVGAVTAWSKSGWGNDFDPEVDDAEDVVATPLLNLPRSATGYRGVDLWWLGGLANGTKIAKGQYKMRFAVLKPFGNPKAADNWDVVKAPMITVL